MAEAVSVEVLQAAIEEESAYLDRTGLVRSDAVTFEIARSADMIFMGELLVTANLSETEHIQRNIQQWGLNEALLRTMPERLAEVPFRLFPSRPENQSRSDDFLRSCGSIRLAERMLGWLREGLVAGEYREHGSGEEKLRVLLLSTADSSLGDEAVGRVWLRWESDARMRGMRSRERELMVRYREIGYQLAGMCGLVRGAFPTYDAAYAMLGYFEGCAEFYLDRMFGQDLLGPDDLIGGFPFSRYLAAVRVLSAMQHLHLAVLDILRVRHPEVDLRNLLAWPSPVEATRQVLSARLKCDGDEVDRLLAPLTLTPDNAAMHSASGDPVWPALIHANRDTYIHPLFGLDINPYLFLLSNLRQMHRDEWDIAANRREGRWQSEMTELLRGSQYDQVRATGMILRADGRQLTDVDFTAYDRRSGDLLLVQMKWQHPVGADDKARRSMARNLGDTGNQWIDTVLGWIDRHGADELIKRLGFQPGATPRPRLFVLARYHAQFSGSADRDARAEWTSWPHFRKAWQHVGRKPARDLAKFIRRDSAEAKRRHARASLMFQVGDLSVMLNPRLAPPAA